MKNCFINGIGCVSSQDSSNKDTFFENFVELNESVVSVYKPNYKEYIKPTMIRRMANGVKNGVVASAIALNDANVELPEAIITGSGMGCLIDSEKFLKNIIDNDEQFLTPTAFIQSTHNTVGAQIALGLQCKAYNVTYVHNATSFESSLIDAKLMFEDEIDNILVGGVDEIASHTIALHKLIEHVKDEKTLSKGILKSNSKGAIFSEGAQFFVLENKKTINTYAKLVDVAIYDTLVLDEFTQKLTHFLQENQLQISDLDLVILGNNGDVEFDKIYNTLQNSIFKNTQQLYYKHLSGEYNTASAFGMWTACQIIKKQEIPSVLKLNEQKVFASKNVLLYNQYRGENHSFTLLSSC